MLCAFGSKSAYVSFRRPLVLSCHDCAPTKESRDIYYDAALTGKRIQKLRKSQGLTQEQLAEELNISAVHMSKIEIGKRSCSLDVLAEIAVFFGASLDYLVLGKSTEKDLRGEIDAAIRTLENLRNSL